VELREFILAFVTNWVALMSGIFSVVLMFVGFFKGWKQVPRWALYLGSILCFFFSSFQVWAAEYKKVVELELNADGPNLIIQYSPSSGGNSSLSLTNEGKDAALGVKIEDIRVGDRTARFENEIPAIQPLPQPIATMPTQVILPSGVKPSRLNDLADMWGSSGGQITIAATYWATDSIRQFRSECLFRSEPNGPLLIRCPRRLMTLVRAR
jgi:hypothetical protein